jgi:hypothetical protein
MHWQPAPLLTQLVRTGQSIAQWQQPSDNNKSQQQAATP